MHPIRAVLGPLLAMHRAWKSNAAKFPKPRMKMVAQLKKIAFGKGVNEVASVI